MTSAIQNALDKVKTPGAVLLKEGVYNVSRRLILERNGVVLRGEGEGSVIVATGTDKRTLNSGLRCLEKRYRTVV